MKSICSKKKRNLSKLPHLPISEHEKSSSAVTSQKAKVVRIVTSSVRYWPQRCEKFDFQFEDFDRNIIKMCLWEGFCPSLAKISIKVKRYLTIDRALVSMVVTIFRRDPPPPKLPDPRGVTLPISALLTSKFWTFRLVFDGTLARSWSDGPNNARAIWTQWLDNSRNSRRVPKTAQPKSARVEWWYS